MCTLADLALYPYTKWADEAAIDLNPYPAIQRWLLELENEPSFLPLRGDGAVSTLSFEDYFGLSRSESADSQMSACSPPVSSGR